MPPEAGRCVSFERCVLSDQSLVRTSPINCMCVCVCVSECDTETSAMRKPEPTRAVEVLKKSVIRTYNNKCVDDNA